MFCLLKSCRLEEPPDPPAPPTADKVPESDEVAPALASASALASAFERVSFELVSVFVEVDGAEGVAGGVQVGQLVPPLRQFVARAAWLAMASTAATMRWVVFTGVSSLCWVGFCRRAAITSSPLPSFEH